MCAENIVVLPELENAIADKNVLALHIRESLKEVDELLKSLKNKSVEKLKEVEHKMASIRIELDSVSNELSINKYTALILLCVPLSYETYCDFRQSWSITN